MADALISGRFEGPMSAPKAGAEVLELRVDVDGSVSAVTTHRISGDFFAINTVNLPGAPPKTWKVYRESWIVETPEVTNDDGHVTIAGTVRFWDDTHPAATIAITIPAADGTVGPAQVAFTFQGGTIWRYTCPRTSDAFRDLELEVDVCKSVNHAPLLPDYNTSSHSIVPAAVTPRNLTIERTFADAGVAVVIGADHTVIDDSAPQFATWSDAELHDAMESHFSGITLEWPRWAMWGLVAGSYEDSRVGGVMFDTAADFNGATSPERQGFAIFRNHAWFTHLPAGAPANDTEADALRQYLHTFVHEAGHAFNFLHPWNKNRPDALSYMQYAWRYDMRNGKDAYWKSFEFRFDDEELVHLRHGNRASVIMGGDAWGSGGHSVSPPGAEHLNAAPGAHAYAVQGGPIELLLRGKGYYDFMEPVTIEARLRNLLPDVDLQVDTQLQPEFGGAVYFIRRPSGRIVEYAPIACKLSEGEIRTLAAAPKAVAGADRHSEQIDLTYGRYGFYFDEPGEYLIRALYQGAGDLLAPSNTLRLRVGHPASPDVDRQAQDFFVYDVGMNLYLGGSPSPHLKRGFDVLREMAEKYSKTVMGAEIARAIVKAVAEPFFRVQRSDQGTPRASGTITQIKKAAPDDALKFTDAALNVFRTTKRKALNLAYGELVQQRAVCHQTIGETKEARQELQTLRKDLEARGAHPPVLGAIDTLVTSLAPPPTGTKKASARRAPMPADQRSLLTTVPVTQQVSPGKMAAAAPRKAGAAAKPTSSAVPSRKAAKKTAKKTAKKAASKSTRHAKAAAAPKVRARGKAGASRRRTR